MKSFVKFVALSIVLTFLLFVFIVWVYSLPPPNKPIEKPLPSNMTTMSAPQPGSAQRAVTLLYQGTFMPNQ